MSDWQDFVSPDDKTVEEFIRRLAKATVYNSHDTGQVLDEYWKNEAISWVRQFDKPEDPDYSDGPCPTCGN